MRFDVAKEIDEGCLSSSPMLEGIVISCCQLGKKIDPDNPDKTPCMRGRNKILTEAQMEKVLIASTELQGLSSKSMMALLGLNSRVHNSYLHRNYTLLQPFLAISTERILENLQKTIDLLRLPSDTGQLLELVFVMDETALWRKFEMWQFEAGHKVIGGYWDPKEKDDISAVDMHGFQLDQEKTAPLVMNVLVKRADHKLALPIISIPMQYKTTRKEIITLIVGRLSNCCNQLLAVPLSFGWDGWPA